MIIKFERNIDNDVGLINVSAYRPNADSTAAKNEILSLVHKTY